MMKLYKFINYAVQIHSHVGDNIYDMPNEFASLAAVTTTSNSKKPQKSCNLGVANLRVAQRQQNPGVNVSGLPGIRKFCLREKGCLKGNDCPWLHAIISETEMLRVNNKQTQNKVEGEQPTKFTKVVVELIEGVAKPHF
eukprot:GHVN01063029.1.p1 GENE.GHVN01063029.1~~GHVN01063029.1.p1  ORF type:complete len:139 (-),score=15.26 GHVN01063029.1:131-547(-)